MATLYRHRLTVIVPAPRVAALRSYVDAQIDPGHGANWFRPGLASAPGAAPTHYVACFAATNQDLLRLMGRLVTWAGFTLPAAFRDYTRADVRAYWQSVRAHVLAQTGVRLLHSNNDGDWTPPVTLMEEASLTPVQAVLQVELNNGGI